MHLFFHFTLLYILLFQSICPYSYLLIWSSHQLILYPFPSFYPFFCILWFLYASCLSLIDFLHSAILLSHSDLIPFNIWLYATFFFKFILYLVTVYYSFQIILQRSYFYPFWFQDVRIRSSCSGCGNDEHFLPYICIQHSGKGKKNFEGKFIKLLWWSKIWLEIFLLSLVSVSSSYTMIMKFWRQTMIHYIFSESEWLKFNNLTRITHSLI